MLSDKDRDGLMNVVGKRGAIRQGMFFGLVPLALFFAAFKFYMGELWADMGGYSLPRFLVLWVNGVSADKSYSGSLIKAGDDMTLGVLYIGLALMLGVIWQRGRQERERTQRIINSLKRAGAW